MLYYYLINLSVFVFVFVFVFVHDKKLLFVFVFVFGGYFGIGATLIKGSIQQSSHKVGAWLLKDGIGSQLSGAWNLVYLHVTVKGLRTISYCMLWYS